MSLNGQFQAAQGTVLARATCECCGGAVQIKANKNGGAYYYCGHADDQGTQCCHSQRWGQRISWALRKAYREAGETPVKATLPLKIGRSEVPAAAAKPANADNPPADNIDAAPEKRAAESRGGLFG
ncbi:MAG: hypothetical protein HWE35_21290 [Rhodobacteraceae bacterium]|nr:hypothetical protein [Paracoccaceae bacterium]